MKKKKEKGKPQRCRRLNNLTVRFKKRKKEEWGMELFPSSNVIASPLALRTGMGKKKKRKENVEKEKVSFCSLPHERGRERGRGEWKMKVEIRAPRQPYFFLQSADRRGEKKKKRGGRKVDASSLNSDAGKRERKGEDWHFDVHLSKISALTPVGKEKKRGKDVR